MQDANQEKDCTIKDPALSQVGLVGGSQDPHLHFKNPFIVPGDKEGFLAFPLHKTYWKLLRVNGNTADVVADDYNYKIPEGIDAVVSYGDFIAVPVSLEILEPEVRIDSYKRPVSEGVGRKNKFHQNNPTQEGTDQSVSMNPNTFAHDDWFPKSRIFINSHSKVSNGSFNVSGVEKVCMNLQCPM